MTVENVTTNDRNAPPRQRRRVYSSMISPFGYLPLVRRCLRPYLKMQPDLLALSSLSVRDADGQTRRNPLGAQLPREIPVASPWLTGLLDPSMELARKHGYRVVAPWETNRGCPYSCTFCDWGSNTLSKL